MDLTVSLIGVDDTAAISSRHQIEALPSVENVTPQKLGKIEGTRVGAGADLTALLVKLVPNLASGFVSGLTKIFSRPDAPNTIIEITKAKTVVVKFNPRTITAEEVTAATERLIAALRT
jgi:hypothetical protein